MQLRREGHRFGRIKTLLILECQKCFNNLSLDIYYHHVNQFIGLNAFSNSVQKANTTGIRSRTN